MYGIKRISILLFSISICMYLIGCGFLSVSTDKKNTVYNTENLASGQSTNSMEEFYYISSSDQFLTSGITAYNLKTGTSTQVLELENTKNESEWITDFVVDNSNLYYVLADDSGFTLYCKDMIKNETQVIFSATDEITM